MSKTRLRSAEWFDRHDELGVQNRACLRALGWSSEFFAGKPVIGIANSWSELNPCNLGLRAVAEAVKRGVIAAGGVPLEFNTSSLGEELMKPSAMLYRNLMAMEVEETLRAYPLDGIVLLSGCDKTTPAQLMAAASAGLPAIQVCAGPRSTVALANRQVAAGVSLWKAGDAMRAGQSTPDEWAAFEEGYGAGIPGTCNSMGTASTMATLSEALGMMLPGTCAIPASDSRRLAAAERSGSRAVTLVKEGCVPARIMTAAAFENAIRVFLAIGGSTNAVIHLIAIARRLRIALSLDDFDRLARDTPVLANLQPAGEHLMADFDAEGGLPALMGILRDKLNGDCLTVAGKAWSACYRPPCENGRVILSRDRALLPASGLVALRGSLAPRGALLRVSTASARLLQHRGQAVVFDDYSDMLRRIDDESLAATADSVLVLRNAGAVGVPGLPEWGNIPIPAKLLRAGVRDMVRISDSRMSGTAYGTVVLHVTPEAAVGGPLALVQDGDWVELDVAGRRLHLDVPEGELMERAAALRSPKSAHQRGYPLLYQKHVLQPDDGCDFDFLQPATDDSLRFVPPQVGRS